MKMKKGLATVAMTLLLCVPATQSFAFSWSPLLSQMQTELVHIIEQEVQQKLMNSKLGALLQKGTVIGEIDRTRMGTNDVFRAVLSGSIGGALTSDSVLADLMNKQISSGKNDVLGYINNKLLGTVNDTTGKNLMFAMDSNGKIDVQAPVISKEFNKLFDNDGVFTEKVDLPQLNTTFDAAEASRQQYLQKQMNATQQRSKELMESNNKIIERIAKYNEQLQKDAEKTKKYQQELEKMSASGADEATRQALINKRNSECLSEADIQRIQTAIASDTALLEVNSSAMKANNENMKIMSESAKLQSEIDQKKRADAEAQINKKSSQGFLEASIKTNNYDPAHKYSVFRD